MKKGILLAISSLPSNSGIGTFGREGYLFCDFLKKSGQTLWQILPLGVTSFGDSPYQSPSSYAINSYFIDFDLLSEKGLLNKEEYITVDFGNGKSVDYAKLYQNRKNVLSLAFDRFEGDKAYFAFCNKNSYWLNSYATFMSLKDYHGGRCWQEWEEKYKFRKREELKLFIFSHQKEIEYYKKEQYFAYSQWKSLKKYANSLGIEIIGDMPIYLSLDSHDVWQNPKRFMLNKDLSTKMVAGVPPDGFTPEGQLWGNPLYDWEYEEKRDFKNWIKRIKYQSDLFDHIRIDHFRGFEAFFAIPNGKLPKSGKWIKAPGQKLFETIKKSIKVSIIAEDLGLITPAVRRLLKKTGFPNMKVMQFGFDNDLTHEYLPENYPENCIAYTGTHDNETTLGWYNSLYGDKKKFVDSYINGATNPVFALIEKLFKSKAKMVIVPIQDYLLEDNSCRMNTPGKKGGNWVYRIDKEVLTNRFLMRTIKDLSVKRWER